MTADGLNYGAMMQKALRSVMAESLGLVAENGLPGEHHFYITYDTTHPGVDMPDWLRERHPEEITIVIQFEFDDLVVTPDRFSVALSFSNRRAVLVVPLDAVKTFVDPHVEFGLKFDAYEAEDDEDDEDDGDSATGSAAPEAPAEPAKERDGPADVVSLDSFRKK